MIKVFFTFLLLIATNMSFAEESACKTNEKTVGDCWNLRGRIQVYNGTPSIRIWPVGTKRLLGVVPPESEIMPNSLKEKIKPNVQIFADLVVCPFTVEKSGRMQMVCIESANNIRVENK
jgi:hypothetical protein